MNYLDNCITDLFHLGLKKDEILLFLIKHGYYLSRSSLKRHLKRLHLYRRKNFTSINDVISFLESQLLGSGRLHGYKWMHLKCLHSGIIITQETVRLLLNIIDPHGVSLRRKRKLNSRQYFNKGPNFLWHMDGYDKLKPYGICISGCIDGYSRKVLWLKASSTNNDPKVIAGYYIENVRYLKGFPRTVRADMGTENGYVEDIQIYFHETAAVNQITDAYTVPPFIYGTSQNNQRIESWWSILRKHCGQYWMNLFSRLKDDGLFTGNIVDKSILQFCFMDIIQEELNNVVLEWNMHLIRKNRHSNCPSGRPDVIFNFPQIHNSRDHLIVVEEEHLQICEEECVFLDCPCSNNDVHDLCKIVLDELGSDKPTDPFYALNLYKELRDEILTLL
ncbi:unnamed protein product [Brassicogethes aeneus]|uniref:Integrase core domain-containing protein n=1 Tax=Brassicogethes aeneus TaxID=1431903 RepID=A0A9P0AY17_BRAAE|nr:unnamed protein product [Brassicogethes aeneus]